MVVGPKEMGMANMKFLIAAVLALSLVGCKVVSEVPTMKYCDEVNYTRLGNDVVMDAHCTVPPAGLI